MRLLNANEVAQRLALSPLTVRKWISQRRLPVVRLGRAVRVREDDVEALARFGTKRSKHTDIG
jgi:excisionase family DNA binding protein